MLNIDRIPGGTVLKGAGRIAGRGIGPLLCVVLVASVLVAAAAVTRDAYGKPHMSRYVPGRDGAARIVAGGGSTVPIAVGAAPTVKAGTAAGAASTGATPGLKVIANPNISSVPATIDAYTPYGPPVARTDWVITKDYAAHGGHSNTGAVDFAIWHDYQAAGTPLVATHAGKVKLLQDDPTYGNLVYVIGPHYTTTYGHLQKFYVKDGDQVVRGTVLGEMGATGNATGPHVDYQVWHDGDNQDPINYGITGTQGAGPMHQ
jgi:murein DD-endopeptidase MepM/ murein hydrolase activator NlpD